jgi:predicted membrane protein DUF2238
VHDSRSWRPSLYLRQCRNVDQPANATGATPSSGGYYVRRRGIHLVEGGNGPEPGQSYAQAGANFLGSQGDIWDAQKDMLMDTLGAVTAVVVFLVTRREPNRAYYAPN